LRLFALFFALRRNILALVSIFELSFATTFAPFILQQPLHQLCKPSRVFVLLKKKVFS
jgi:hypothetical protein